MDDIAEFDLNAIDRDFIENPFPTLHRLRSERPVHYNTDGSVYLTGHADCLKVYQSRDMLSDKTEEYGKKFGKCPLHTPSHDQPDLQRTRPITRQCGG